jgi:hypothetical protein
MTITTRVRYKLTDATDQSVLFDEVIMAPFTATVSDAFVAVTRVRVANEGSAKANIEQFLEKLSELQIGAEEIEM